MYSYFNFRRDFFTSKSRIIILLHSIRRRRRCRETIVETSMREPLDEERVAAKIFF